jgi:hypothetical protein
MDSPSYGHVLRELGVSVKDLFVAEVDVVKAEIKESSRMLGRYAFQAAIFGVLIGISIFPLLAFCIIGLGRLLNDNYWLSSLIVGLVCAGVGGLMGYRTYQKFKRENLSLPVSRHNFEREKNAVLEKIDEVKEAGQRRAV